jgi:hypothetical protein
MQQKGGNAVQELVGHCKECNIPIYCKDGFLDGIVLEDNSLHCFDCYDKDEKKDPAAKNRKVE